MFCKVEMRVRREQPEQVQLVEPPERARYYGTISNLLIVPYKCSQRRSRLEKRHRRHRFTSQTSSNRCLAHTHPRRPLLRERGGVSCPGDASPTSSSSSSPSYSSSSSRAGSSSPRSSMIAPSASAKMADSAGACARTNGSRVGGGRGGGRRATSAVGASCRPAGARSGEREREDAQAGTRTATASRRPRCPPGRRGAWARAASWRRAAGARPSGRPAPPWRGSRCLRRRRATRCRRRGGSW